MKKFKRISVMLLAVVMTVLSVGATTAFAAEPADNNNQVIAEDSASSRTVVVHTHDKVTISTTRSVAGNSFVSPSGVFDFDMDFQSASGRVVALRLHDQTTGRMVQEWQTSSGTIVQRVFLTAGHRYIFEYLLASGSGSVYVTNFVSEIY